LEPHIESHVNLNTKVSIQHWILRAYEWKGLHPPTITSKFGYSNVHPDQHSCGWLPVVSL